MFMYTERARYWWEKHRVRAWSGPGRSPAGLGPRPDRVRVGPGPRISTFLGFGLGSGLEFQVFSGPGLKKRVPAAP